MQGVQYVFTYTLPKQNHNIWLIEHEVNFAETETAYWKCLMTSY